MNNLVAQRCKTHGPFKDDARYFSSLLFAADRLETVVDDPEVLTAMTLIMVKMARILAGDSRFADHWADIEGYASLVRLSIEAEQNEF